MHLDFTPRGDLMWRDYINLFPSVAAVLNGFLALFVGQFFKDRQKAKIILVEAAGLLGFVAIGSTFYSQQQVVAAKAADEAKHTAIREELATFIAEGNTLMTECADASKPPPV